MRGLHGRWEIRWADDIVQGEKGRSTTVHDEDLHAGLLRRDQAALAALMDKYMNPVYTLCARILDGLGTGQDVEECVSDTFYACWLNARQFRPDRAPLRTWLLMQAKYAALGRRRRLARRRESPGLEDDHRPSLDEPLDEALATSEERQHLQAALNSLPPLDRQLVYRRYFLEEKVADLAQAYGLTRQAADNHLWRARQTLRSALGLASEEDDQ